MDPSLIPALLKQGGLFAFAVGAGSMAYSYRKELKELYLLRDQQVEKLRDDHKGELKDLVDAHRTMTAELVQAHSKEVGKLNAIIGAVQKARLEDIKGDRAGYIAMVTEVNTELTKGRVALEGLELESDEGT